MDIPRGSNDRKFEVGRWRPWKQGPPEAPAKLRDTAAIQCPRCHCCFSVVNHKIDARGNVSPSVVCPHKGCTFHEFVRLVGWP